MKKFFVILMAVMFVAGFVGQVYAEDRLSLSGQFRARAWHTEAAGVDNNDYFDQRLRVGGTIKANDNVSVSFRMDLSEGVWGRDFDLGTGGWADASENNEIGLDRAYIDFTTGIASVRVGQYWNGAGINYIWDHQATGVRINLDLPVKVMLEYAKMDEKGATTDEADLGTQDDDFFGINLGFGAEAVSGNVLFATLKDASDNDDSPWAIGLQVTANLGVITLNGELDYFGGSLGDNVDYVGTQLFLDAGAKVTDNATVGAMFLYAMGTDENDEIQRTAITAGGESFTPLGFRGDLIYDFYPVGSLYGGLGGQFNPGGNSSGVVGGALYCDFNVIDALTLHAVVGYVTPEEDDNTVLDNATSVTLELNYQLMDNVRLSAGYGTCMPDYTDNTDDDPTIVALGQLAISY